MITLTIKRQDASVYWIEHFGDQITADAWLTEEQTRPYWSPTYTCEFVDDTPILTNDQIQAKKYDQLRIFRNARLRDCDYVMMSDYPISSESKAAFVVYRQALRDLPSNTPNPDSVTWPEKPEVG